MNADQQISKQDFFQIMDGHYLAIHTEALEKMGQTEYEQFYNEALKKASEILEDTSASKSYLDTWIALHLPNKDDQPEEEIKVEKEKALTDRELIAKVLPYLKFFMDRPEEWQNSTISWKITKIYFANEAILEIANYKGIGNGLQTLIGGKREYFSYDLTTSKLKKLDQPTLSKNIVNAAHINKLYSAQESDRFLLSLKIIKSILKHFPNDHWKELYQECGDLQQKLEKNPEVLRNFHKEVKKRRKSDELYSDAMTRVAGLIKEGKI